MTLTIPFEILLAGLAYYDWKHQLIKNKVVIPSLFLVILYRLFFHDHPWMDSIMGFFISGGIFLVLGLIGQVGGGDMKLMALVGFVIGLSKIWIVLGVMNVLLIILWLLKGNKAVPLAPFIFVSVTIQYLLYAI